MLKALLMLGLGFGAGYGFRKLQTTRVGGLGASPPGWKGTVEAMKRHPQITNPYALAWSMHNKGFSPHY